LEGADRKGNRSSLSFYQICVITSVANPDNSNDMTLAYVAETGATGMLFLSMEAVFDIMRRLVEQCGDLAEQPKWME